MFSELKCWETHMHTYAHYIYYRGATCIHPRPSQYKAFSSVTHSHNEYSQTQSRCAVTIRQKKKTAVQQLNSSQWAHLCIWKCGKQHSEHGPPCYRCHANSLPRKQKRNTSPASKFFRLVQCAAVGESWKRFIFTSHL